jgi:tRNA (Thr-GGU) A37 N-methylase
MCSWFTRAEIRRGQLPACSVPDRSNPVGLHRVEIASIDGARVRVRNLEELDGTPIVDVKPVLGQVPER